MEQKPDGTDLHFPYMPATNKISMEYQTPERAPLCEGDVFNGIASENSKREERISFGCDRRRSYTNVDLITFSDSSPDETSSRARRKAEVENFKRHSNEGSISTSNLLITQKFEDSRDRDPSFGDYSDISSSRSSPLQVGPNRSHSGMLRERLFSSIYSLKKSFGPVLDRETAVKIVSSNRQLVGVVGELLEQMNQWLKLREKEKLDFCRASEIILLENQRLKEALFATREALFETNARYESCNAALKRHQQSDETLRMHSEGNTSLDTDPNGQRI